jgi:stage IV sporulation protein B
MRKKFLLWMQKAVMLWALLGTLSGTALAAQETLIPGGEPVGIQLTVEGVLVAGTTPVETSEGAVSPAQEAGIQAGDIIIAVNGRDVDSAADLVEQVDSLGAAPTELTVLRNGDSRSFTLCPVQETDGQPRLGLWLRDGVSGIGTITYIDPETGAFGALGHGINDMDSGALLPIDGGSVCQAQIVDVKPGQVGSPGELSGSFSADQILGQLEQNTSWGIFGVMGRTYGDSHQAIPVAAADQVVSGPATILACVSGQTVQEYAVEITRTTVAAGDGRDLLVRVTDPALLAATGGIVQGMSGSPILQNGRLVGAVTHVLVGDPSRGYGILLEHMLSAADTAA